jgi:hypothetical protein
MVTELAKTPAETEEPIASSSAVSLITGEVYLIFLVYYSPFPHTLMSSLLVRVVIFQTYCLLTLNQSSRLLLPRLLPDNRMSPCLNFSVSGFCFLLQSKHWLTILRR